MNLDNIKEVEKSEHTIQNEIRLVLSQNNCLVFRANVGRVRLPDGRYFDTGLPKGFSDLFGVRLSDNQIFFIEVKDHKGKLRKEQELFLSAMKDKNIVCGVARSAEDALKIVKE